MMLRKMLLELTLKIQYEVIILPGNSDVWLIKIEQEDYIDLYEGLGMKYAVPLKKLVTEYKSHATKVESQFTFISIFV